MSEERFDRIDQRLDRLDGRFDELGRHMRMLHEEAMDSIKATREYTGPTRAEFADMMDRIGRRIDPLEIAVRHHSVEIERLKQGRS